MKTQVSPNSCGPYTEATATFSAFKDEVLGNLAEFANVAQFVSFAPDLGQRYSRVIGYKPNHRFSSTRHAIEALLLCSPEQSINIRSFSIKNPKNSEFIYGLRSVDDSHSQLWRLAANGFHTIVNETIDVNDGGVSGVSYGGVLEFAPGDSPRCVEKPGTLVLPSPLALRILETVYHFRPSLNWENNLRVEFSIHPLKRGVRHDHTIVWEIEELDLVDVPSAVRWPNHFSRMIGDKAFGLLVAGTMGFLVPATTVIPRAVAPFSFGSRTGTGEVWIRTSPREPVPGFFSTEFGWRDPFLLMNGQGPNKDFIASLLAQEAVDACYSGALITKADGRPYAEGVAGRGDDFMQGRRPPEPLPVEVVSSVMETYGKLKDRLGPVRFEWVFDSEKVWVLQLHCGGAESTELVVYPGRPASFRRFEIENGIEALRELISEVEGTEDGILLIGRIGMTSHMGDLLRRSRIPSRIAIPSDRPTPTNLKFQF